MCIMRCVPKRYVVTFICFTAVVIAYVQRSMHCISYLTLGILKMSNEEHRSTCNNATNGPPDNWRICKEHAFTWDTVLQGYVLSSFYLGYLISHLPSAYLVRKVGGKYPLGVGILGSSLISVLSPAAACHSVEALIVARSAMGFFEGTMFPAITDLLAQWAPPSERTLLTSIVFAAVQVGTVISVGVTEYMLQVMMWDLVYYILGLAGAIWFFFLAILCFNHPSSHPYISASELEYLQKNIPETDKTMPTPWSEIIRSKPFLALVGVAMGHECGLFTIIVGLPKFYCSITNFNMRHIGVLLGLPYLLMWIVSVFLGYMSDKLIVLQWSSRTRLRVILSTIGAVVPAVGVVWASHLTNENTLIYVVTISLAFMGGSYASLRVNPIDLSPNHSATIMAITEGLGSLAGLLGPSTAIAIIEKKTIFFDRKLAWQNCFWITFYILVLSNIPFMIYGSGDVQYWDSSTKETTFSNHKNIDPQRRRRSFINMFIKFNIWKK